MTTDEVDIFLLEPDVLLARSYIDALKISGYTTMWFANAEEAIVASAHKHPKIIVIELQLAGHNGIEFIQELRSYPELDMVPIVVNSLVPERELLLSEKDKDLLGITAYCYKPQTSIDYLLRIVKGIVKK